MVKSLSGEMASLLWNLFLDGIVKKWFCGSLIGFGHRSLVGPKEKTALQSLLI